MNPRELRRQRLTNLGIAAPRGKTPTEVVSSLCALQAQDAAGALWAIGLRLPAATLSDVEHAVREREIVRTWPMRGTLHYVAAADVHWMLDLLAPRVIKAQARRHRELALSTAIFARAEQVLSRALEGGKQLTREQLRETLARAKLPHEGQQLGHCIGVLAMQKVLCGGAPSGKQGTFTLLSEWVKPPRKSLPADEALAKLAERFFSGHGPATLGDLARWGGITLTEAKRGIAAAESALVSAEVDGIVHWFARHAPPLSAAGKNTFLLPGFDEYMLGYKDRDAIIDPEHFEVVVPGKNGMFKPTIVDDGRVIGTWRAEQKKQVLQITTSPFLKLTAAVRKRLAQPAERYRRFLGRPTEVIIQ